MAFVGEFLGSTPFSSLVLFVIGGLVGGALWRH